MMSIHIATDNVVCAAPCSLLPQLKQPRGEKSADELLQAIEDVEPGKALHELKKSDPCAKQLKLCDPGKTPTRQKLLALNQSLASLLKLRLSDSSPSIKLRGPSPSETRHYHNGRAFYWCSITKESTWQCTMEEDHCVRMSVLIDEGEATSAHALCNGGLAIFPHRDTQHKLHREELLAVADVDEIHCCMKETLLVLKSEYAPWATAMFGRRLRESMQMVHQLPVPHVLLDLCGPGIIDDLQLDPMTSQCQLKEVLVDYAEKGGYFRTGGNHKLGRWADWVDNFNKLRKVWRIKLFFHLFSYTLEGISPFAALAGHLANATSQKVIPRVLRVS